MILKKSVLEDVLARAMSTGADFAEVFAENTRSNAVRMIDSKVDEISDSTIAGVGIRAFDGLRCVSASTTDLTYGGLMRCAGQVADVLSEGKAQITIHLTERIFPDIHPVKIVPDTALKSRKTEILKSGYFAAKEYSDEISQVSGTLLDVDHNILVANSDGLLTEDRQIRTRLAISAVASKDGENQSGSEAPGRRMGLEVFEEVIDPVETGREAARSAVVNLHADYCPAGKMTVAIENGFGGVIFHESCGHSLEATSVAHNTSQMAGRLGQVIANEKVTAFDDGTTPGVR